MDITSPTYIHMHSYVLLGIAWRVLLWMRSIILGFVLAKSGYPSASNVGQIWSPPLVFITHLDTLPHKIYTDQYILMVHNIHYYVLIGILNNTLYIGCYVAVSSGLWPNMRTPLQVFTQNIPHFHDNHTPTPGI